VVRSEERKIDVERRIKKERKKLHQNIIIFLNMRKTPTPVTGLPAFSPQTGNQRLERG
jgi:hypothetical protein